MIAEQNGDVQPAAQRHHAILLGLLYRYMTCLFWVGAAVVGTIIALLLYESVALTRRLFAE